VKRVVLVDAGGTNIGSVRYALERLGAQAELSRDAAAIQAASHVILPGVGAAAPAMQRLREFGLVDVVRGLRQPVLGVCLGMQLLFARSEESDTPCLDVIDANVVRFRSETLRIPHMGWNSLRAERAHVLLEGLTAETHAYFVHSYAAPVGTWTLASTDYAGRFSAIVQKGNFFGMQFHPERSSTSGARLLRNFLDL
jgi:glutamine amidotransferase